MTLIEALVALVVMSFGMVAVIGLMSNLRRSADLAKQRSEAMRIAQAELGQLRSFSMIERPDVAALGVRDYVKDIVRLDARNVVTENSNATFSINREVLPFIKDAPEPQAKSVQVTVHWTDRAGVSEQLRLDSVIARVDPAFAGSLSIAPPTNDIRQPNSRSPVIPVQAKDLGNKTSAFRPDARADTVWVFNNLSGVIVGKCSIDTTTPVTRLTADDVEACSNNTVGYLVSGTVRFSTTNPPNPSLPEARAVPLTATVNLTSTGHSITPAFECFNQTPVSAGVPQTLVNYSCIVYPNSASPRIWSGQVLLSGLSVGTSATQYLVCRYSADYNGDGKLSNDEHPFTYTNVAGSLARQNFLVIRGDLNCPSAPAVNPTSGVFVDYSTAQQQPS